MRQDNKITFLISAFLVLLSLCIAVYIGIQNSKDNKPKSLIEQRHELQKKIILIDSLLYENSFKIDSVLRSDPLSVDSSFRALQKRYTQP